MEDEIVNKKPFFIILSITIFVVLLILIFENGSTILNKSKYKELDKIVIDAEYSNVEVQFLPTDEINVMIYGKRSDELSVREIDKVLTIKKTSNKGVCIFNCADKIILYLPKEFEILDVSLKMGDLKVENVTINDVYVSSDIGNVSLGTVKSANIEVNIGNVNIKKFEGEFDSYIKVNKGNVTINHASNFNIEAKSNTGKVNVKEEKDNELLLRVETNIGNIKIK